MRRTKVGALLGAVVGAIYALTAAVLILLPGKSLVERSGVSVLAILATYVVGLSVVGALMGLISPIAKFPYGGAVMGLLGGFFFGGALIAQLVPNPTDTTSLIQAAALFGCFVGIPLGHFGTSEARANRNTPRDV